MVRVEEAEKIIQSTAKDFGTEITSFEAALNRIMAEDIKADRDLPPFNRSMMDGIAINYSAIEEGMRSFSVKGTQAAGESPIELSSLNECIEIMTGGALPSSTDTVVRYEDVIIESKTATLQIETIRQGQNIHRQGSDKKKGETIVPANQVITPAILSVVASVGMMEVTVKKLPKVIIISTGDELVEVSATPSPFQIRQSNSYTIQAVLQSYGIAAERIHIRDDFDEIKQQLEACLREADVLLLTGGISMGKFDYVPKVLEQLTVQALFHKVQQRPGKPFWFGSHAMGTLVFAFPGNPVSTFLCLHRYFLPWLKTSLGLAQQDWYAQLAESISFKPSLQYFVEVKLILNKQAQLTAHPLMGNGSGDFANLSTADAFMELPLEGDNFTTGEVYRIWPFKNILL